MVNTCMWLNQSMYIKLSIWPVLSAKKKLKFAKVAFAPNVSTDFCKGKEFTDDRCEEISQNNLSSEEMSCNECP